MYIHIASTYSIITLFVEGVWIVSSSALFFFNTRTEITMCRGELSRFI